MPDDMEIVALSPASWLHCHWTLTYDNELRATSVRHQMYWLSCREFRVSDFAICSFVQCVDGCASVDHDVDVDIINPRFRDRCSSFCILYGIAEVIFAWIWRASEIWCGDFVDWGVFSVSTHFGKVERFLAVFFLAVFPIAGHGSVCGKLPPHRRHDLVVVLLSVRL